MVIDQLIEAIGTELLKQMNGDEDSILGEMDFKES
jgi:hypothetical protein